MCLLTFLPAGVQPDLTALHHGAAYNNDGHGYAIVAGPELIVQRGMQAEAVIDAFAADRRRHTDGPALFHSRLTTHGDTSLANCHPFPIGGDPRTVLAHNGILPASVQPGKGDPRSDTRIAAEDFLPTFGSLRSRRNRLKLQRWLTPYNKMVILTVDRRYRDPAYVLNEDHGTWDSGIWYSNDSYLPPPPGVRWFIRGGDSDWTGWNQCEPAEGCESDGRCPYCRAIVDLADTECRYCGWCFDCNDPLELCTCYPPAALDRHRQSTRRYR